VCTSDGKVSVFDLAQQKHEPLCQQKIVKKAKLTKIAFNPKHPILLVGDDHGCVTALKLSPNLRKRSVPEAGQTFQEMENAKLEHVIDIALKSRVREDESTD
jgi:dynein intermediate chain 1